jgi:hypothetical protein
LFMLSATAAWAEPPAPVPKTGQTMFYATGDDGDYEKGVAWPVPRFTDNLDGTVTDNLTDLIWLQNANCTVFFSGDSTGQNSRSWGNALTAANSLTNGFCGLTDSSSEGDWRLPNVRELLSLNDYGTSNPSIPSGHPFTGAQGADYWSSTTHVDSGSGWRVHFSNGQVNAGEKSGHEYVWPVRDAWQEIPPNCGDGRIQWKQGETCDPPSSICGARGNPDWVCSDTCKCEFIGGN